MKIYSNMKTQGMKAYYPPLDNRRKFAEKGGLLCDFNEGILDKDIMKEIKKGINTSDISMYPEYTNGLIDQIAQYSGVSRNQVLLTNGSDQGIDLIFRTFTGKGDKVIIPTPSFAMFYQCANISENKIVKPAYKKEFGFPLNKVLDAIDKQTKLIVICNPNNPTGTIVDLKDLEKIIKKAFDFDAVVYIDEAYYEFSGVTAAGLIAKYPNLLITRTFSKAFALAGMRIGYVLGQRHMLSEMRKIGGPYDVNMIAVRAAEVSLMGLEKVRENIEEAIKARELLEEFLEERGIEFWSSKANFVLFKPVDSQKIWSKLESFGVQTRKREGMNIDGTLRISARLLSETNKIIQILKKIL